MKNLLFDVPGIFWIFCEVGLASDRPVLFGPALIMIFEYSGSDDSDYSDKVARIQQKAVHNLMPKVLGD